MMGFNGFFFARVDYQDYQIRFFLSIYNSYRASQKTLEFVWRGVQSYGSTADMFTYIFWSKEFIYVVIIYRYGVLLST